MLYAIFLYLLMTVGLIAIFYYFDNRFENKDIKRNIADFEDVILNKKEKTIIITYKRI